MSDERDAYLDSVLIGGREIPAIVVVPYDETWPTRFESLSERILAALGPVALSVQHIGSTSVPGLAAKPLIDVLLTVTDVETEDAYVPAMEAAGFVLRVREDHHRMFRTPKKDVHIHVYQPEHSQVSDYIALRNHLRANADDRDLYARTKRALAEQTWSDMNDYADAKTDVIAEILGRARGRQAE
ncbi:GrpB family protein [Mycetocola sp. JXN-3]|uniref:GrpB family protein n=1 Tax=Mycetocola sp. JXN-3 TaxID=2116510 RepID=UPI00165D01C1|nr:GrpB family protein [Mycetocola sp. JXN-3]